MKAGTITVTFALIIFLSFMSYLSISTRNKDPNTSHNTYSSAELHRKLNASANKTTPYYDLSWKDRMEFEKSVWGFDLKDMLILGILFGVFFGSVKMASVYRRK